MAQRCQLHILCLCSRSQTSEGPCLQLLDKNDNSPYIVFFGSMLKFFFFFFFSFLLCFRLSCCRFCSAFCHFSRVWLFATLWTAAHQAPLSMGFSRQEHWSGLPRPSPEDSATSDLLESRVKLMLIFSHAFI